MPIAHIAADFIEMIDSETSCCIFVRVGERIVCERCRKEYHWPVSHPLPVRNCGEGLSGHPFLKRAINFAKAAFRQVPLVAEYVLTGDEARAFRSQAEIEAIAKVCKACPLFNGDVCTHKNCGCPIDKDRSRWWSKVAFKSAFCPDTPRRW